jgi:mono/diheme cytochrome c family protein
MTVWTICARLVAVGLAAALPAPLSALGAEAAPVAAIPPPDQTAAEMIANGKVLYGRHCSHCHGFNMVTTGTITYDLRQFPRDGKERFVHSVIYGKNSRMPQWGDLLSLDEIDELWAYVRTGGQK